MIEVDWEGNILWKWSITDHFDELGFDEAALNILARNPNMRSSDGGVGDYQHVNCMSYLGPTNGMTRATSVSSLTTLSLTAASPIFWRSWIKRPGISSGGLGRTLTRLPNSGN